MEAFFEFVTRHWYFAVPMFLMSLAAVTLVIWRIMLNINAKTDLNEFLPQFQQRLEREGPAGALNFCRARPDYIPRRLFVAGLESSKQGLAAMRRSMASVIELEIVPDLNFLLAPILAIAKIATMVGLLGTVVSMIFVFNEMGSKGSSNPQDQGKDIGLALFATALGLTWIDDGHPVGLQPRAFQGLDHPLRSSDEKRRPETAGAYPSQAGSQGSRLGPTRGPINRGDSHSRNSVAGARGSTRQGGVIRA